MENEPSEGLLKTARAAQEIADGLCDARIVASFAIADRMMSRDDFQSWKFAGAVALTCTTDIVDGKLSRWGANIIGTETTAEGARKDGDADKVLYDVTLGGLIVSAANNSQPIFGSVLQRARTISNDRDQRMGAERDRVAATNLLLNDEADAIKTGAVKSGQIKTWFNNIGLVVACSPLSRSSVGRAVVAGLYSVGARLALKSEADLLRSIAFQESKLIEARLLPPKEEKHESSSHASERGQRFAKFLPWHRSAEPR